MKKMIKYLNLLLIIGFISCHKDKENPCASLKPTSADFIMEEYFQDSPNWTPYDTDTTSLSDVKFTAIDSTADSYEWHIGAGVYITRSKVLTFPGSFFHSPPLTSVSIMLIVKKKPNKDCFPKDNGIDTVARTLYFRNPCTTLTKGKFFGHNEDTPKDTFTVSIEVCKFRENAYPSEVYIGNLSRGCARFYLDYPFVGYKQLHFFAGSDECFAVSGTAKIDADTNSISIDYIYYTDITYTKTIKKRFLGKRIKN